MEIIFRISLVLLLHFFVATEASDSPLVKIAQGEVEGVHLKSRDGKTYSAFMGIPYANKQEKFELAEPVSSWDGIKDATKFGSVCPQWNLFRNKFEGDEECLFVNIFTPNVHANYPVMVFIHGGGFFFGNSNENGADYFMDEEVVFVTINYRLSALGFLSTGDRALPGNLGLKDQRLALQFIQQNIKSFGGDPKRVTLFGESAGSASVNYHILSPGSADLFQSAICHSGSSLNAWALSPDPKIPAFDLAKKLNCPTTDSAGLKKCLKSKSINEILKHSIVENPLENLVKFAPVVELPSPHAVITEHPEVLYKTGRFNKVPLVMTICEKEGLLINSGLIMKDEKLLAEVNDEWMEHAPSYFLYDDPNVSKDAKDIISKRIYKFYFGDKKISQETFDNLTNLYSDSFFIHEIRNTILLHAKHAPVYPIILGFEGYEWSQLMRFGYEKPLGMTHADDLPFLFNYELYPKFVPKSFPETTSKYFVKAWVTMATQGNPNINQQVEGWAPVSKDEIKKGKLKWLLAKRVPKIIEDPFYERMNMWDKVSKKLKAQKKKRDEL
ncbi:esterase 6 [Folsomia candida]|nr:esterase 6 [Folsomia candida]